MKNFILGIIAAITIAGIVFVLGALRYGRTISTGTFAPIINIDYSRNYPASPSDKVGFEFKKETSDFVVYYHAGDEIDANKTLAVLDQAGVSLYQNYLGISPQKIPAYLADSVREYVKIADFPGGEANVQVGDGSAPHGQIFLYKPFEMPSKSEGMIIHEGTHAVIFQFLGNMQYLPGFLNEGLAHYLEFIFTAGPEFDPFKQGYFSRLLTESAKTGKPKLLNLKELSQKCEGYISDENLGTLCRAEGVYAVWYVNKNFGKETLAKFLTNLKQTHDWQKALGESTGKTLNQLNEEFLVRPRL